MNQYLGVGLSFVLLARNFTTNDIFSNIIFLGQIKQFADLVGSFRAETFWDRDISQARNISFSLLGNDEGKSSNVLQVYHVHKILVSIWKRYR